LEPKAATRKVGAERKRPIDEAVACAVGHRIRIDSLAILAEGKHSSNDIAAMLGEDVRKVSNHVRELYECGCIESAGTTKVRNATEHFYRAVTLPYISDEAYRAMPKEARREVAGLIIQAITAETLASLRAGKLETDEDLWLAWDCLNLDAQGRREVADEFAASFDRLLDIKVRNATRLSEAGEVGTTTIVSMTGFERSRPGRPLGGYSDPVKADQS
jgi:predicted transcriptional regulator